MDGSITWRARCVNIRWGWRPTDISRRGAAAATGACVSHRVIHPCSLAGAFPKASVSPISWHLRGYPHLLHLLRGHPHQILLHLLRGHPRLLHVLRGHPRVLSLPLRLRLRLWHAPCCAQVRSMPPISAGGCNPPVALPP